MIVDVFAVMDNAPHHLRRPMLPFAEFSYRIPLSVTYDPRATGWPEVPWYRTEPFDVNAVIVNGRRLPLDESAGPVPAADRFKLHVESDATYVCVGLDISLLWQYERVEVIATTKAVVSLYGSKEPNGEPNPPMIAKAPAAIARKADALRYARMSFEQIAVDFIKEDEGIYLYGGEMVVMLRHRDEFGDNVTRDYPLGHYVITGVDHDLDEAKITAIDFRYLLNAKHPVATFEREEFPFLEDRHLGNVMPECIGIGNGIPGVCLNGMQVYDTAQAFPAKIERYAYRFPPGFAADSNLKIEVKMNGNNPAPGNPAVFDDTWVEVFPGLGNPRLTDNGGDGSLFEYRSVNPLLPRTQIDPASGLVHMHFLQALKGGRHGNDPNEVRMFARWPNANPFNAIQRLLRLTGNETVYSEFLGEFNGLADVGLYMDESRSMFEWIEQLQSANTIGGQLFLINDRLFFRQENPNRNAVLTIPVTDVINHEELSVGVAEEFMYSGWDIAWRKSHADSSEGRIVGSNIRYPTAPILNGNDATANYYRRTVGTTPATLTIRMMRGSGGGPAVSVTVPLVRFSPQGGGMFEATNVLVSWGDGAQASSPVVLTMVDGRPMLTFPFPMGSWSPPGQHMVPWPLPASAQNIRFEAFAPTVGPARLTVELMRGSGDTGAATLALPAFMHRTAADGATYRAANVTATWAAGAQASSPVELIEDGTVIVQEFPFPMGSWMPPGQTMVPWPMPAPFSGMRYVSFSPTEAWEEGWDTDAVQQRVRIIRDLINTFRHRAHGVKVPMTRAYLELQIYDVVRYLPKPLEGTHFGPLEWMVYKKQMNIAEETITFDLVQRVRSQNWNGGNE